MTPGATAWLGVDPHGDAAHLSAKGTPEAVAALLAEVAEELPPTQRVTLPCGTGGPAARVGRPGRDGLGLPLAGRPAPATAR